MSSSGNGAPRPLTLANIHPIRNPGVNYVSLARPSDIDRLRGNLSHPADQQPTGRLTNWRIIKLVVRGIPKLHVLADSIECRASYITSPIIRFDQHLGIIVTQSRSLYRLLDIGAGEPPECHVRFLFAAITAFWGIEDVFEFIE